MWPSTLSGRLPVVAMVGLHPAIQLMGRGPVPRRPRRAFPGRRSRSRRLMRYYPRFPTAIPRRRVGCPRVTHPSAALGPEGPPARLACLRRAASVRSEPGSNSPSLHSSTEVLAQHLGSSGQDPPELNRLADNSTSYLVRPELTRSASPSFGKTPLSFLASFSLPLRYSVPKS